MKVNGAEVLINSVMRASEELAKQMIERETSISYVKINLTGRDSTGETKNLPPIVLAIGIDGEGMPCAELLEEAMEIIMSADPDADGTTVTPMRSSFENAGEIPDAKMEVLPTIEIPDKPKEGEIH